MPVCDFCGEYEGFDTKCNACGKGFCEYCGFTDNRIGIECLDNDEDDGDEDDYMC